MADHGAGMRAEGAMVIGAETERNKTNMPQTGRYGLVAALLVALLIAGVAAHDRRASHPAAPAISRAVTSQQTRFLENNTTNLPNAVTANSRPVVTSEQQKFLDVNGAWLPAVAADVAPLAMTSSERRLLEVNTTMLAETPSYPYAEDMTPLPGHRR